MTTVAEPPQPVEAPPAPSASTLERMLQRPTATRGFWSWWTTVDHKKIGLLYGVLAILFFVVGGIEALLIRVQLFQPNGSVLTSGQYNQLFTMHGTTMVFLVGMPIAIAFGNYFIPLMIGARDVAFPRLNMFGFWVFILGGAFIYSSFFLGGAPDGGWFGYTPLTSAPISAGFLPGRGPDFWTVGLVLLGIGTTTSAVNFIVTILNMRAPGMTLMRMPVFVWMMLVTAFLAVFAMPVVTAALIQVFMDRNFASNFFVTTNGGDPLLYQHLFWLFGHPEVYILILPGMGIISEVLPVFSRKPLFGYAVVVFSGIAIGFMGWGVWAHHMFATGIGPVALSAFALSTMFIAVPTGVKIFNWLGTMIGGALRLRVAMLFAIGFIAQFTIGGLSGVMHSIVPADTQQTDTYFVVAHFHYVLFGGLIFAVFAGIYYWFPKIFGRMMNETLGKWNFWLLVIGFNLTFFPMHILGLQGLPRRTYQYADGLGWQTMNQLATIGGFITAISVATFAVNAIWSWRRGQIAGPDPWDGRTLEWSISSPPPEYNFLEVPQVHSRDDFWHQKYTEDDEGRMIPLPRGASDDEEPPSAGAVATERAADVEEAGEAEEVSEPSGEEHHGVHMPSPSYFPLVVALGLPLVGYGLVFRYWWLSIIGLVVLVSGVVAWAIEPGAE